MQDLEWIEVTEKWGDRLPRDGTYVLIASTEGHMYVALFNEQNNSFLVNAPVVTKNYRETHILEAYQVMAWRELPNFPPGVDDLTFFLYDQKLTEPKFED